MNQDRQQRDKEEHLPDGLRCPSCNCAHLPVAYTRHRGKRIMRVRHCRHCGRRVVTYEAAIGGE